MLTSLLSSRVRAEILVVFYLSPGETYNTWAMAKKLHENYSAVWKELLHLEEIGILNSEWQGRTKEYQINPDCPIAPELRSIVLKTEGVGKFIREKLQGMNKVKEAFIYGSFASGEADARSDLDLMIIGECNLGQLAPVISDIERELNRPINYVIFSEEEWSAKKEGKDPFYENVVSAPKIILIGEDYAL